MIELKDELFAAPVDEWQHVPIAENHHKWWLRWYRIGDGGKFCFAFESPKGRRYSIITERGRVTNADITLANGKMIASYWPSWGDKPEKMDAVIRLTPTHILDRLSVLLDAIR